MPKQIPTWAGQFLASGRMPDTLERLPEHSAGEWKAWRLYVETKRPHDPFWGGWTDDVPRELRADLRRAIAKADAHARRVAGHMGPVPAV